VDCLIGEGCYQRNPLLSEVCRLQPPDDDGADRDLLTQERDGKCRANPDLTCDSRALRKFFGLTLDVDDVNRLALEDSAAGSNPSHEGNSGFTDRPDDRDRAVVSDDTQHIAVDAVDQRIDGVTETRRILRDGVENGLKLSR